MIHNIVRDLGDRLQIQISDGTNWMSAYVEEPLYSYYSRGNLKENTCFKMLQYDLHDKETHKELVIVSILISIVSVLILQKLNQVTFSVAIVT